MPRKSKKSRPKLILQEERKIEDLETKELQELESLKKAIKKDTSSHPLTKITRADVVRSVIGALIGTVGHFAFFYGVEIADKISVVRVFFLYIISLIVCFFFLYFFVFRKVK